MPDSLSYPLYFFVHGDFALPVKSVIAIFGFSYMGTFA